MKNDNEKSNIKLIPATQEDFIVVQNMFQYYVYDIASFVGRKMGWKLEENGLYELIPSLPLYWQEKERKPFLVRVNGELAGFVLVNKVGTTSQIDWTMGEFFIMRPYQRLGIGQYVAHLCFDQFLGNWEVMVLPGNEGAYQFWLKTIKDYTQNHFAESFQKIAYKRNEERHVFQFTTR